MTPDSKRGGVDWNFECTYGCVTREEMSFEASVEYDLSWLHTLLSFMGKDESSADECNGSNVNTGYTGDSYHRDARYGCGDREYHEDSDMCPSSEPGPVSLTLWHPVEDMTGPDTALGDVESEIYNKINKFPDITWEPAEPYHFWVWMPNDRTHIS